MLPRRLLILLLSCFLVACGASERVVTTRANDRRPDPQQAPTGGAVESSVAEAEPVSEAAVVVAPIVDAEITVDAEPIDHREAPCFTEGPLPQFSTRQVREGGLEVVQRASIRPGRHGELRAPAGSVVRLDVTFENVGDAELILSETTLANLREAMVAGARLPITSPSELRPGQHLIRGAILRLCLEFDVGRAPLAVSERTDGRREYVIGWYPLVLEAGHPLYLAGPTIFTQYVIPSGRHRERDSWGGVIRVQLAPGASLLAIARDTGVQVGTRVPLFQGREEYVPPPGSAARSVPPADAVLVEVPAHRSVRDAATALMARGDVVSALPVMQGDPGTEGCSQNSPCGPGLVCGYPCGIPGCPNGCMSPAEARTPRP